MRFGHQLQPNQCIPVCLAECGDSTPTLCSQRQVSAILQACMPDPDMLHRVFGTLEEGMQHCEERFLHLARYHGIIKPTTTSLSLPVCPLPQAWSAVCAAEHV